MIFIIHLSCKIVQFPNSTGMSGVCRQACPQTLTSITIKVQFAQQRRPIGSEINWFQEVILTSLEKPLFTTLYLGLIRCFHEPGHSVFPPGISH